MADQLRWWKLWASVLTDDSIRRLPLRDFGRWCYLGVWLRQHGDGGIASLTRPGRAAATLLGCRKWCTLLTTLRTLPGVVVEVLGFDPDGEPGAVRVSMKNWQKYQEDSSRDRTRKWRERQRSRDENAVTSDASKPSRVTELPSHVTVQTRRDGLPYNPSGNSDADLTTRECGTNPRAIGTNPRATGTNPRAMRMSDRPAHKPEVPRFAYPPGVAPESTHWAPGGRWPYEAFHHDCPERNWRGRCVRAEYAASHESYPVRADGQPRTCPGHAS